MKEVKDIIATRDEATRKLVDSFMQAVWMHQTGQVNEYDVYNWLTECSKKAWEDGYNHKQLTSPNP